MYKFVDIIKTESMKKIEELSTIELARLSEDEFEKLLNEEKAEAGIPIVKPEFPKRNTPPNLKTIDIAYRVGNIYVLDMDEAKRISEFLSGVNAIKVSSRYEDGKMLYLTTFEPENIKIEINGVELSSHDEYEKRDADIHNGLYDTSESYDKKKNEYYAVMDKINDFNSKRTKIYLNAVDKMNRIKQLKRLLYEEYMPIAKGDEDMAMSFLKKVYPDYMDEEVERYIFSKNNESK